MDIYSILQSKSNNPHHLQRYFNFIQYCIKSNEGISIAIYTEEHHICPKAKDLFPEYTSFRLHPWNKVHLTARQHMLAHWMLWKAYGKSQTYAFKAMQKQLVKSTGQINRYTSRHYEMLKNKISVREYHHSKGKAQYKDAEGNILWLSTTDPRVLSGEVISTSCGRTGKHIFSEHGLRQRRLKKDINLRLKYPDKKIKLYFLDIRIELQYYDFNWLEYIEQGWSTRATKEFMSANAVKNNGYPEVLVGRRLEVA
jgi:hypothetical protein